MLVYVSMHGICMHNMYMYVHVCVYAYVYTVLQIFVLIIHNIMLHVGL